MTETTLHFDFTQKATRQQILDTVLESLDENKRAAVIDEMAAIAVVKDHHHNLSEIAETIKTLPLSEKAKQHLFEVYDILAHAEAAVHECALEETHFHEVGRGSAVQNTAGICHAIDCLAPERITATPVQTGSGKVECAHGLLDIPAPATQAILDTGVPVCAERLEGERCTPTSAALIKHYVEEYL